jgi:D-threo-aldose 1-dehydrogenase
MTPSTAHPTRRRGRTDLSLTVLGFGGSRIGNLHGPVPPQEARNTLSEALLRGVRYFDTAPLYAAGLGEHRIGEALRDLPREAFVLSTKFGRLCLPVPPADAPGPYTDHLPFRVVDDYGADAVMRSLEASLLRLGQSRIDIALIHDIDFHTHGEDQPRRFREAMDGAYVALDRLRAEGVIGAVGVGVNSVRACAECAAAGDFDAFLLAREFSLLDRPGLAPFLDTCRRRGIGLVVGAPFNVFLYSRGQCERR